MSANDRPQITENNGMMDDNVVSSALIRGPRFASIRGSVSSDCRRSQSALVFMAKWPEAGRSKTRLSPPLTAGEAAELARCFLLDTLGEAARADADCFLAFAPLSAADAFRRLAGPSVGLIPAEAPHLGIALREGQRAALALGYRRVALVGSDLPHLPASRYTEAFAALAGADVAIGPSGDGGYYLLASERETPQLFDDITWSTPAVYQQTVDRAAAAGLRLAAVAGCDDVDTAADLPALHAALHQRPGAGYTLAMLERLGVQPLTPRPPLPQGERGSRELGTVSYASSPSPLVGIGVAVFGGRVMRTRRRQQREGSR